MTAGLISGFNPIQDYSNLSVPSNNTEDASKFGDVLKSSTENQANLSNEAKPKAEQVKSEDKTGDTEKTENDSKADDKGLEESKKTETDKKPVEEKSADADEMTEDEIQVITEALSQIMQMIAQTLDVPVQEVEEALDTLELDISAVAEPANVPELVVEITDAASTMDIMTDEKLYEAVKEITAEVEEVTEEVAKELDIEPQKIVEVVKEAVAQAEPKEPETETVELQTKAVTDEAAVTEEKAEQPVRTDDNNRDAAKEEADNSETGKQNQDNPISFVNNTAEMPRETPVAETESPVASYTNARDIINQVADSIRMEIKADMNEMEINLHPASLGNVKVQLTSRDGMITANFTAQNDIVKEAIESQLVTLRENMNQQGIKVEAIEVTVESHAFDENLSKQSDRESKEAEEIEVKKKKTRSLHRGDILVDGEEEADDDVRIAREMMMANGGTVDYLT